MRRSEYKTIFYMYRLLFFMFAGIILAAVLFLLSLITFQKPDGSFTKSNWPKEFTKEFAQQIIFEDGEPSIKQTGISLLQENNLWIQILNEAGIELYSYQKRNYALTHYSGTELLQLFKAGFEENPDETITIGIINQDEKTYSYLIGFPTPISKVTMYFNGAQFSNGKTVAFIMLGIIFLAILAFGLFYGYWTTKAIAGICGGVRDIAKRSYLRMEKQGIFEDVYRSLDKLNAQIKESDQIKEQTETLRREWIANITHDLKTPLSPIKGYAELLSADESSVSNAEVTRYANVMLKNISYMESLMNDLKLTYQLESGSIPLNREKQDLIRFLKELVIDNLNNPAYENRRIHFDTNQAEIPLLFDRMLLTRAFQNLMINAFVHTHEDTKVTLQIKGLQSGVEIQISDNGNGMTAEEVNRLFSRYYRGADTEQKPEGTGLGLAIAKQIVELHGGTITVSSFPGSGTTFYIILPQN